MYFYKYQFFLSPDCFACFEIIITVWMVYADI